MDRQGDLYANLGAALEVTFISLCKFGPGGGLLEGPVGGDFSEVSGFAVEVPTGQVYVDYGSSPGAGASLVQYGAGGEHGQTFPVPGAHGAGVGVSSATETVYLLNGGAVEVFTPAPPSAPAVKGESVSAVTGESASLSAEIEPHGAPTEYRFEYLTEASYLANRTAGREPFAGARSVPSPEGYAGADFNTHDVGPEHILGLTPGTTYHYRVVVAQQGGRRRTSRG